MSTSSNLVTRRSPFPLDVGIAPAARKPPPMRADRSHCRETAGSLTRPMAKPIPLDARGGLSVSVSAVHVDVAGRV